MPLPQNTFAPKNKTKGLFDKTKALMSKRKPEQSFCYAPTEESGCIFRIRFFNRIPGGNRWWRYRTELMQIPGCICRFALGFCKNIKKRAETLYQSFSPFIVERRGFEPLTSTMRTLRATNCANAPNFLGKFCADSPLTAWPTFTVLGIKYGRLVLPTVLTPHKSFVSNEIYSTTTLEKMQYVCAPIILLNL